MDDKEHDSRGRAPQVLQQGEHLKCPHSVFWWLCLFEGDKWKKKSDFSISFPEKRRSANRTTETQASNHISDSSGQGTRAGTQEQLGWKQVDSTTNTSQVWILMDWIPRCCAHLYLMSSRFCQRLQPILKCHLFASLYCFRKELRTLKHYWLLL